MNRVTIDVREYREFASGHIPGSRLVPLDTLGQASTHWNKTEPLLIVCRTGRRAEIARQQLAASGFHSVEVLEGGVEAWRLAGKPLTTDDRKPWSIERQVRIVTGSLVLLTLGLAYAVSPYFLIGTGLIGAGQVFAGVSDICMMASLLARLPWNRPAQ